MAADSYRRLLAAADRLRISPVNRVEWSKLAPLVSAFNRARTDDAKTRILDQMKLMVIERRKDNAGGPGR